MSEYKMSDVFVLPVSSCKGDLFNSKNPLSETRVCKFYNMNQFDAAKAAAHAINNHDRLTAQVEELKSLLELAGGMGFNTATSESSVTHRDYCKRAEELLTRIGEDNINIEGE